MRCVDLLILVFVVYFGFVGCYCWVLLLVIVGVCIALVWVGVYLIAGCLCLGYCFCILDLCLFAFACCDGLLYCCYALQFMLLCVVWGVYVVVVVCGGIWFVWVDVVVWF